MNRSLLSTNVRIAMLALILWPLPAAAAEPGEQVYADKCAACHQQKGEGVAGGVSGSFPALANSTFVSGDARPLISVILSGRGGMPSFRFDLNDSDLSAVASYLRTTFNKAAPVTPDQVKAVRGGPPTPAAGSEPVPTPGMAFTVSMPQPSNRRFHVTFRVDGLEGETHDFKIPAWHPGYYRLIDYAKDILNLRITDGSGRTVPWEKVTRNTWRAASGRASTLVLDYDVLSTRAFAAQNYLGENRAFIAPTGMYLHIAGQLQHPVTVTFQLPQQWTRIATGLDPVPGRSNTFFAADFDTLYDGPTLIGNQETLEFDVQGKKHTVAIEDVPASVDRQRMIGDLKRIVETAGQLIGDIPYKHYAFLMMGSGAGGIEHSNSSANSFDGNSLTTENGYRSWLSFISHEYFHHYNVKRIRPLALGPFDYDTENVTNMLWVSEGLSVYYQDLVMVRAGLLTTQQYFDKMQNSIGTFENSAGHRYQSATDSSMTTWGTSGVGNDRNTTISYYSNGAMIGAMLDLKIREASGNRRSLDDVMRGLYRKYYQEKKRGFTEAEFREECEAAAGGPLTEVFEYASTTKDVDYAKYFAYAGLKLNVTSQVAPGSYIGLNTQTQDGRLVVVSTTPGSPSEAAGLTAGDRLLEVDGTAATPKVLNDMLAAKKPGDRARLKIARNNANQETEIALAESTKRSFQFQEMPNPSAMQSAILKDWLRSVQ